MKNPYEFQDRAAALLGGMAYHTPFVTPRGKDGGFDIIAYRDPLGTTSPRIKLQIPCSKYGSSCGCFKKDGDVKIFVSSGGFTPDARTTARNSQVHVELIDLDRFIALWQDFHSKLVDE